jgi:hypothetical protein
MRIRGTVGIVTLALTALLAASAFGITFGTKDFTVPTTGYGVVTGDFTGHGKRDVLDVGSGELYFLLLHSERQPH